MERIEPGEIYILDKEWAPYENPIHNSRPVVIIRKCGNYVETVSLDVAFKGSKKEKRIFIEYYVDGKKRISVISCDVVQKIPYKYFYKKVGYIGEDVLEAIRKKAFGEDDDTSNVNIFDEIRITNEKQAFMLDQIYSGVDEAIYLIKEPRKRVNVFIERLKGFFWGVMTSIVADVIINYVRMLINNG